MNVVSTNILVHKLETFGRLSDEDRQAWRMVAPRSVLIEAKQDLICEGQLPGETHLIVSGVACRYKILEGGGRQIIAYVLPGDFCDLNVCMSERIDFSVGTLSRCGVVKISRSVMQKLQERPAFARAIGLSRQLDDVVAREWMVNIGRRSADSRLLHLLSELAMRFNVIGLVSDNSFTLSITQSDLADTLGITHIHLCRMLKVLQGRGLVQPERGRLIIVDIAGLRKLAGFNPSYLNLLADEPMKPRPPLTHDQSRQRVFA